MKIKPTILLILGFVVPTSCVLDVEEIDSFSTTESLCLDDLNLSKNVITEVRNIEFLDAEIVSNDIVIGDSLLNGELLAFNRYVSDDGTEEDSLMVGFTKQLGAADNHVLHASLNFDSYDIDSIGVGKTVSFDEQDGASLYATDFDFSFEDLVDCTYRGEYTSPFSLTNYCGDYFAEQPNDGYSLYENDVTVTRSSETDYSVEDEFFIRDWSVVDDPHGPEGFVARFVLRYELSKNTLYITADRPELTKSCDVKVYSFEYIPDLSGPDVCLEGYFNANGISLEPYSDYRDEEGHVAVKACAKCVAADEAGNMVLEGEEASGVGYFANSTDEICYPEDANNDILVNVE